MTVRTVGRRARGLVLRTAGRAAAGVRTGLGHGFGSGVMADYAYRAVPQPHPLLPLLGRLADRRFLEQPCWSALRSRRDLLGRVLREEIACRGGEIRVLDVASGPGRYLLDLLVEEQPGGQLRVVCRDLAPESLRAGRRLALRCGLPEDSVTYERGDALDPAPLPGGAAPDIVIASGLYELVPDDEAVRESLERLRGMLAPDGVLLFTTRLRHAEPDFAALAGRDGDPAPVCRTLEDMEGWAEKAGFGSGAVRSEREGTGHFAVTRCTRTEC
ncbi:class I SAM-dependent methyltransferase family protein [Streptomyces sp. ODS28]|uniref:class I SAM-dependent methyltransferase family protein n=1 Tax=Streptomyces sp. ODS28 TaxID=3136688 RepID=UPI0031F0BA50